MEDGNGYYPLSRASELPNRRPNLAQATPDGPRERLGANGTRPPGVRRVPALRNLVSSNQRATDDDNSSSGSTTPRAGRSTPNGSGRSRSRSINSGLTSSISSRGDRGTLPHTHLSTSLPKPEALKELLGHLTSPPQAPNDNAPSEDTRRLVKQWRLLQYRDVREREHHLGSLLGWPSEYTMGTTAEAHMDKALNATFAPQIRQLEARLGMEPVQPTFTYGFTSTAFTAPQNASMAGMHDSTKAMPPGEDPLFPFLAQKWINDGSSRREAELETSRAGVCMCRALWNFYRVGCKWEATDVIDTLSFTMVVSPEVCRLFVHWIEKAHAEGRGVRYHRDLVYATCMESAWQVHKMRLILDRLKDWMRDLRLANLKDALDIMIEAASTEEATERDRDTERQLVDSLNQLAGQHRRDLEEQQRTNGTMPNGTTTNESKTNGSTTNGRMVNGSTTNGETTDVPMNGSNTNGSRPSEKVNARPAERQRSNSTTHSQRLDAERPKWHRRKDSEAERVARMEWTERQEELSLKFAIQSQKEEDERAQMEADRDIREAERRRSIKAAKTGVNPDKENALLDDDRRRSDARFNWVPIKQLNQRNSGSSESENDMSWVPVWIPNTHSNGDSNGDQEVKVEHIEDISKGSSEDMMEVDTPSPKSRSSKSSNSSRTGSPNESMSDSYQTDATTVSSNSPERTVQGTPKKKLKMSPSSSVEHYQKITATSEQGTPGSEQKTHSPEQDLPLPRVSPKNGSIRSISHTLSRDVPGSDLRTEVNQKKAATAVGV